MICNSSRLRQINRSINGQLTEGGKITNVTPLEINTIIPYNEKKLYFGGETITYAGCPAGVAYIYVPQTSMYVLNKRGLTVQSGAGDPLSFTSEKSAWHIVQTEYVKEFLGGSNGVGGTAGSGFVIEITLPALT